LVNLPACSGGVLTRNDIFLTKNDTLLLLHEESDSDGSVISPLSSRRLVR
jgi:hypothetical protein